MWELWKEVLCRGRQRGPDGAWYAFGPRHVAAARRNVALMLSRGVQVPCVWGHLDVEAADPEDWKARYAKQTFGHVAGQRVNDRGNLELLHRGPDVRDRDQLLKVRYVSPKVYPGYSDSRGGQYRGTTIAHVAATPTPVQFWQRPFELSRGRALYLSYTPGDRPMADEKDGEKDGEKGGEKGGDAGEIGKLIEALRESGMNIPDEVTDVGGLIISIKSNAGSGGDDLDDELDAGGGAPADTAAAPGAPMLMSDERAAPLVKMARRDLETRVKALFSTGRVDRPTARKLLGEAKAVALSFTRGGEPVPNRVAAKVEAFEELPKGQAWSRTGRRPGDATDLADTRAEDAPAQLTGGKADAKLLDFMCAGLPAKR